MSMADSSVRIYEVTAVIVRKKVEEALHARNPALIIDEFVGRVDWSQPDRADVAVRDLIGRLEGLTHALSEGDIAPEMYRSELETLAGVNVR